MPPATHEIGDSRGGILITSQLADRKLPLPLSHPSC